MVSYPTMWHDPIGCTRFLRADVDCALPIVTCTLRALSRGCQSCELGRRLLDLSVRPHRSNEFEVFV